MINLLRDNENYRTDLENIVYSTQAKFTEVLHRIIDQELGKSNEGWKFWSTVITWTLSVPIFYVTIDYNYPSILSIVKFEEFERTNEICIRLCRHYLFYKNTNVK